MRHITREPLEAKVQAELEAKTGTKFNLSKAQRREVVTKLIDSQKSLCAYCECRIDEESYHIEHFVEQQSEEGQDLIHTYSNMLLSCQGDRDRISKPESPEVKSTRIGNITCGHKKSYSVAGTVMIPLDYNLLLNPSATVTHLFDYTDGIITPNEICTSEEKEKVDYTVNRLNLDSDKLNNRRIQTINLILDQITGLTEDEEKEVIEFLLEEKEVEENGNIIKLYEPYYSTIKDHFGYLLA